MNQFWDPTLDVPAEYLLRASRNTVGAIVNPPSIVKQHWVSLIFSGTKRAAKTMSPVTHDYNEAAYARHKDEPPGARATK